MKVEEHEKSKSERSKRRRICRVPISYYVNSLCGHAGACHRRVSRDRGPLSRFVHNEARIVSVQRVNSTKSSKLWSRSADAHLGRFYFSIISSDRPISATIVPVPTLEYTSIKMLFVIRRYVLLTFESLIYVSFDMRGAATALRRLSTASTRLLCIQILSNTYNHFDTDVILDMWVSMTKKRTQNLSQNEFY